MILKPKYDKDGGFIGSNLVPAPIIARGRQSDLSELVDAIEATLVPAEMDMIEEWLAELSVMTPPRKDDDFAVSLRLEVYTRKLRSEPADIVRHALTVKTWKFFPSWAELDEYIAAQRRGRDAMLSACLSELHRRSQPRVEEMQVDRGTPEDRARVAREMGLPVYTPKTFGGK